MSKSLDYNSAIKLQGRMNEDSALAQIGKDCVNLNDGAAEGMKGNQFPTFDLSSSSELTSVKSHMSAEPTNTNSYMSDFKHMLGWNRGFEDGLSPLEQDAKTIASLSAKGIPVPDEIAGASEEKVMDYLQHNTVMRIPDDHIENVQNALRTDALNSPSNYFLPENPSEEQITALTNRIQGTGLTSSDCVEQMTKQQGSYTGESLSPGNQSDGSTEKMGGNVAGNSQSTESVPSNNHDQSADSSNSNEEKSEYYYGL